MSGQRLHKSSVIHQLNLSKFESWYSLEHNGTTLGQEQHSGRYVDKGLNFQQNLDKVPALSEFQFGFMIASFSLEYGYKALIATQGNRLTQLHVYSETFTW